MIVVKEQAKDVAKAWGNQKIAETEYRLIRYHLRKDADGGVLLIHTVTGELVRLSPEEEDLLGKLPCAYCDAMKDLVEHHYLVPADYDEHAAVLSLRKILKLMDRKKEITGYTILPTTCCNARCFYCYEADYKHISMTKETADDIVEFIKNHHGDKKVHLGWFGGEPTLGEARIDQICTGLADAGVEYYSTMISNGYLFDEETARKAKELWKLGNIQITLDGTEETYNRVKAYVGVKDNPYQRVLRNIGLLLDQEIRVSVRMNVDRHNADNLRELIGELGDRFHDKEKFCAYAWPLFDDCGFDAVRHDDGDREWLREKEKELNALAAERKIDSVRGGNIPRLGVCRCMADNDSAVIINPDGTFAKCEHDCEEVCGDIKSGFTDQDILKSWKETVEHPECAECPLFPKCVELKKCFSTGRCDVVHRDDLVQSAYQAAAARWGAYQSADK